MHGFPPSDGTSLYSCITYFNRLVSSDDGTLPPFDTAYFDPVTLQCEIGKNHCKDYGLDKPGEILSVILVQSDQGTTLISQCVWG